MRSIFNVYLFLHYFVGFVVSAIFHSPLAGVRYAAFRIHYNGCKECQAKFAAGQRPDLMEDK